MREKRTTITLSPKGAELLSAARARHPQMSTAEILEAALAVRFGPGQEPSAPIRSREDIRAWLDELSSLSDRIPPRPGETFSREMIYQDHE